MKMLPQKIGQLLLKFLGCGRRGRDRLAHGVRSRSSFNMVRIAQFSKKANRERQGCGACLQKNAWPLHFPAMFERIQVILGLLAAVAALGLLARKVAIPYPIFLVMGGLAIALIPGLPTIRLDPDLVLFFFLPPLLYPAA